MEYTIKNDFLNVSVDSLGAQLMSLQGNDGLEYLWQGRAPFWKNRSPILFPFVGRLTNNTYRYCGKEYPMGIHGFASAMEFAVVQQEADSVVFELTDNADTRKQYPFVFSFRVIYTLEDNKLQMTYEVKNLDNKIMPFGLGGHPGFNVPLTQNECFEDYVLEFSKPCQPERIGLSDTVYVTGKDTAFALEDEKCIKLDRNLFQNDAVVLKNAAREVTLRSTKTGCGVRVAYPDMPYIGFYHQRGFDVPYLCIEPWSSLPSRQDVVEEFTCKSDMIQLKAGGRYTTSVTITVDRFAEHKNMQ